MQTKTSPSTPTPKIVLQKDEDILNLEVHTAVLLLKALNKYKTLISVGKAVGYSERHIHRIVHEYEIYQAGDGSYKCHKQFNVKQGVVKIA